MNREWLGILVNDGLLNRIWSNQTHEKWDFYMEAGTAYDLFPYFFRLRDISFKSNTVTAFVNLEGKWKCGQFPLPKAIHNRAIFVSEHHWNQLKRLAGKNIHIYNFWNRYSKMYITQLLAENPQFVPFLPETYPFSAGYLSIVAKRFSSFLLKPNKGTVGKGIVKVDRSDDNGWLIKYRSGAKLAHKPVSSRHLYPALERLTGRQSYQLQETIDLAKYQGSPFDLRVSVQKGGTGEWGLTGIVGKAARPGHFLSNVAQGGRVYPFHELMEEYPKLDAKKVYRTVAEVALDMARYLERKLPYLADIGFDFGIDREGNPYFIEMNGRDQRYSFAKGHMMDTWKKTYENPVAYGRYLIDLAKEREK